MKKNNKGFSLVELIVVVLIMAIIAVALAPQVMKWVENSRKSTDCSNYDTLYEACGVALTDKTIYAGIVGGNNATTLTTTGNGVAWSITGYTTGNNLENNITAQLGANWKQNLAPVASVLDNKNPQGTQSSGSYTITLKADGTVERTLAPDDSKIS